MKNKNKGFTLVETLLTVALMLTFFSAAIFCTNSLVTNQTSIEEKVSEYVTLNRYAKCYAELNGKKTKVSVIHNKLKVEIEENEPEVYTNITLLQSQIDNLNDYVDFGIINDDTDEFADDILVEGDVAVYLPDGSIEASGTVNMGIIDDTNQVVSITVLGFNQFNIIYNNPKEILIDDITSQ